MSQAPQNPEHDGTSELSRATDALFLAMRRARAANAGAGGLSLAQLALVLPLAGEGELPVGDLAVAAGVALPTATRMLKQLEGKGFVTRRRSPDDERRVLIGLTPEGAAELDRLRTRQRRAQAAGYAEFSPDERWQLARQLNRLAEVIDAQYRGLARLEKE
ncbi:MULTISPECIES: MarR family winged helix-turn-helix transcriptional regulator [unclassified Saccharopolyspora]|uniref:MarR family winged helix-turn-helix transcriptional regulator n=2 Tax=Pseudonocardiaceae TaxID=2070 RepID=UPI00190D45BD|nr:MarR family transcriptional regulator [Saccharopolyspora sp. HNM0986]MBK0869489.1 MarR family transcriptional regulator [Saccharopolyspora sp. HNM0986]